MSESKPLTGEWAPKRKAIFHLVGAVILFPGGIADLVQHRGITIVGVLSVLLGVIFGIRAMQLRKQL